MAVGLYRLLGVSAKGSRSLRFTLTSPASPIWGLRVEVQSRG